MNWQSELKHFSMDLFNAVIGVIAIYAVCAFVLLLPLNPLDVTLAEKFLNAEGITDDRVDQLVYLISLLLIPFIVFFSNKLLNKYIQNTFTDRNHKYYLLALSIVIAVFLVVCVLDDWLRTMLVSSFPLIIVVFSIIYWARERFNPDSKVPFVLIVFLTFLYSYTVYFKGYWPPHWFHFEPVIFNLAQLKSGHPTLVDGVYSQYGLYNSFLLPILPSDITVSGYTLFLATLLFIAILSPVYVIFKLIKNSWVALGASVIFISSQALILYRNTRIHSEDLSVVNVTLFSDPYFQTTVIRNFFPHLMIFIVWGFLFGRNRQVFFYLGSLICSVSVLWNFDTGLVCLIAWILFLVFHYIFTEPAPIKKIVFKVIFIVASFFTAVSGYVSLIYINYGVIPDFLGALEYQKNFALLGYFMTPAPLFGIWVVGVMFYLFAASRISGQILKKSTTPQTSLLFFVTIMGLGVFSYYVGRSLPHTFLSVVYPIVIVAILLSLVSKSNKHHGAQHLSKIKNVVFLFFVSIAVIQLVLYFKGYMQWHNQVANSYKNENTYRDRHDYIVSLPEKVKNGLLIISPWSGALHVDTQVKIPGDWLFPSFEEVMTKKMFEQQKKVIRDCKIPYVYVEYNPKVISHHITSKRLLPVILKSYRVIDATEDWMLLSADCKKISGENYLESKNINGIYYDALRGSESIRHSISSVNLPQNYLIEFDVLVNDTQTGHAYIAGNHPGINNFEGFVIQQNASITNEYVFGFGNGKRWAKARKFTLSHGKKHNVKIELGKRTVKIYVNNNLVHKSQRKVNYMNTELPVTIGGYIYGGRELNGTVYKFTIKNL
jgi:hypothetical protein